MAGRGRGQGKGGGNKGRTTVNSQTAGMSTPQASGSERTPMEQLAEEMDVGDLTAGELESEEVDEEMAGAEVEIGVGPGAPAEFGSLRSVPEENYLENT